MGLSAGWAKADITPPVGIHMGGYWGRRSGAVAVHDPLEARAIVWRAPDGEGAVLVALDLVGLSAATVAQLRRRVVRAVAEHLATVEGAVSVCCTHTHAGPLSLPFRGMGEVDEGYLDRVCTQAATCAAQAAGQLAPVSMAYSRAGVQIGINRRQGYPGHVRIGSNPAGPVAPLAHAIVMTASAGRAILFQHACHPVVLGGENHDISADFPGPARRVIEERTGAMAVYVNGAAADVNPITTQGTFDDVDRLGTQLGTAVAEAVSGAPTIEEATIAHACERVELPTIDPPPAARAAVERALQELKTALRSAGAGEWARRVPEAHLAWSRELLALAREDGRVRTQPFEIHGLRVGGVRLLGMEGEIFVRYQLDLETAATNPVVLCGYANGCIGYVPTADEYERGGYEIDEAYKVYPSVLMIAPESEALIRVAADRVLGTLG